MVQTVAEHLPVAAERPLNPAARAALVIAARQLLVHMYLLAGRARDADARMQPLEAEAKTEPEAAYLMVRIKLMKRDEEGAAEWAATLASMDRDGRWRLALGHAFAAVRSDHRAAAYFSAAMDAGFAVEGRLGLAMVATARSDVELARRHLLAALKLRHATISDGQTHGAIFHTILGRLNALDDSRKTCRAWAAAFSAQSSAHLAGATLLVYAPTLADARQRLETIVNAMHEDDATFDTRTIQWKDAPPEHQPVRPVPPGVQCVLS